MIHATCTRRNGYPTQVIRTQDLILLDSVVTLSVFTFAFRVFLLLIFEPDIVSCLYRQVKNLLREARGFLYNGHPSPSLICRWCAKNKNDCTDPFLRNQLSSRFWTGFTNGLLLSVPACVAAVIFSLVFLSLGRCIIGAWGRRVRGIQYVFRPMDGGMEDRDWQYSAMMRVDGTFECLPKSQGHSYPFSTLGWCALGAWGFLYYLNHRAMVEDARWLMELFDILPERKQGYVEWMDSGPFL